jgi:hypothetical protein
MLARPKRSGNIKLNFVGEGIPQPGKLVDDYVSRVFFNQITEKT